MTPSDTPAADLAPQVISDHRGSASVTLSGRAVLVSWAISILAHGALFFGMLALVFPFTPSEKSTNPPITRVELVGPVEASSFVPSRTPELTDQTTLVDPQQVRFTPKEFAPLSELTATKKPELSIIGIGAGGGDAASFGLTVGGGSGVEFFGLAGSARGARKVVFVVDRSGSMIDTFIYVQMELKRSISALRRGQKFHVIFFNSGPPLENPPKRLVNAIEGHKQQFFEFLEEVVPTGGTRPEGAMQRTLAMKPDLVYLLSDGVDFHPSLLTRLDAWNRGRDVRIYTIAYLDRTGSELLEQIAREHNGEFKFVSEDDLP